MTTQQLERTGTVVELPSGTDRLVFEAEFTSVSSSELFRFWTEPELLALWWPKEAEVDTRTGGEYHFAWPGMDWHLRGTYLAFEPGERLSFTWRWDHESDRPIRYVGVHFLPLEDGGTMLNLVQQEYTEEDEEERKGHIEGWAHFLCRLSDVVSGQ